MRFRITPQKSGRLRLEKGFIDFTSGDGRPVFSAPLQEVRASFPRVTFFGPFPLFGTGINLAVGGRTYRLLLIPVEYEPGEKGIGRIFGDPASSGPSLSFNWKDVKQGRAAVRQWRAALGQPET